MSLLTEYLALADKYKDDPNVRGLRDLIESAVAAERPYKTLNVRLLVAADADEDAVLDEISSIVGASDQLLEWRVQEGQTWTYMSGPGACETFQADLAYPGSDFMARL